MAMNSPVQEIKEKIDVVDFLGRYLKLQRAGKYYRTLCPFHKEKNPSFIVSPDRQSWYCFGCQNGGDIFTFLQKYENLEFYEALKVLAEKAGIDLRRADPNFTREIGILYEINKSALEFFQKNLGLSAEATNYLKDRGLKKQTMEEFSLGWSPPSIDTLFVHLINLGYRAEDINRAGLGFRTDKGTYMDRFRGRIMFPIFNFFGKVIGFSARILPAKEVVNDEAKYINSPETPIFKKGKVLYGFHKSKNIIRQENRAFLLEGQMDFLMAWQEGIKFVVATSGTALTPDHLSTLKRNTENLILGFDADEAGIAATERSIDLANSYDLNVKIVNFKVPDFTAFKDVADLAKEKPGALGDFIGQAMPAMDFYFLRYLPQPPSKSSKHDIRKVLAKIKILASPIEQNQWLKNLAEKTNIEEKSLREELRLIKIENQEGRIRELEAGGGDSKEQKDEILSRREFLSQRFISLASAKENSETIIAEASPYLIPDIGLSPFKPLLLPLPESEETMAAELEELIRQLKLEWLKEQRQELISNIKNAEKAENQEGLSKLLEDFQKLNKLIS